MTEKMSKKQLSELEVTFYNYIVSETARRILLKNPDYVFEIKRVNLERRMTIRSIPAGPLRKAMRASKYCFTVLRGKSHSPHVEVGFYKKSKAMVDLLASQDRLLDMNITDDDFTLLDMMTY